MMTFMLGERRRTLQATGVELLDAFAFQNRTSLDTPRLYAMLRAAVAAWPVGNAIVRVRYSRGADFSGRCLYRQERIYVNLGAHLRYPYRISTYLARAVSRRNSWHKPIYYVELADGYQVVLFIFLHEWYHLLVKRARRNTRQKESMCDRFAARVLVDDYGAAVREDTGRLVGREVWDFQDLNGFVAGARERRRSPRAARQMLPSGEPCPAQQLLLFEP